ncbi:MAG: methyltransferase domain-containing protein, partial [Lentisphaeria bacterium]|nr:methyltransferase domain-containing protein [Lentisphaeria bacterium]
LGLDVSAEMIAVARSRSSPGCRFELGDACRLPAGNGTYRVVAAMTTLEFVRDPVAALAAMVRNTAPRGTLLVGTLNRLAPLNRERIAQGRQPYASGHLLSPHELRLLLHPYGRVRITGADVRSLAADTRMPTAASKDSHRPSGRSAAPFLVAAVCPIPWRTGA